MSKNNSLRFNAVFLLLLLCLEVPSRAGSLQLVTTIDPTIRPSAGGGGDSWQPMITPDGRYVLFASRANNLVLSGTNSPFLNQIPPKMNVFLRDCANGTTLLVSVNLSGTGPGNDDSIPTALSANGQFALFESTATDLMPGATNNATNLFLRDLINGTNQLVSASTNGGWANGSSWESTLTPDGRYVAFASIASNLVTNDTNQIQDIFVRDTQSGITTLASSGVPAGSAVSRFDSPLITPDGRYVAFRGTTTNAIASPGAIYVRDLLLGVTIPAGNNSTNVILNGVPGSYNQLISDDGRFVAFESSSTASSAAGVIQRYDLQTGFTDIINTNAVATFAYNHFRSLDMTPDGRFVAFVGNTAAGGTNSGVFVWDAQSGTTTLASAGLDGTVETYSVCDWPALGASGVRVAFLCTATNLTTNVVSGNFHLYVRDLASGITTLVDSNATGAGAAKDFLSGPRLTPDGNSVAFDSTDADLETNGNNDAYDVFINNLTTGTTDLVSARQPALPGQSSPATSLGSVLSPGINGRYLAFSATGVGLLGGGYTNEYRGVFVRDQLSGTNILASVDTNGMAGADGWSFDPSLSGDGRYVAFTSGADNLVGGDSNRAQDIFVRDLQAGVTTLVSVNSSGTGPGNGPSYSPTISADGRYVLFYSTATTLAAGTSVVGASVFLRDLQSSTTYVIDNGIGTSSAAMTADGRFIAHARGTNLLVWNVQTAATVYTQGAGAGISGVAISPDGNRIAYYSSAGFYAADRAANTNLMISARILGSHNGLQFSGDSRYLVFSTIDSLAANDNNSVADVYLYDFQTRGIQLISVSGISGNAANGPSDSPAITPDGRFIAYHSSAGDIVPGPANGLPGVYLYDPTGDTTLVSASIFGNLAANNRSSNPVFSGDSQTLLFQSWASDLVPQDFNQAPDIFALKLYTSNPVPAFIGQIIFTPAPGQRPTLIWPASAGKNYQVQFKNNLTDPVWQNLNGDVTIVGGRGSTTDPAPGPSQRFYRIVAY